MRKRLAQACAVASSGCSHIPASVDGRLRHAHAVLLAAGCDVRALFGPEHGYGGEAQDMIAVDSERAQRGLPVHLAVRPDRGRSVAAPEWLDGLDAVVVDLQDVGSRYYTFVWTAARMLRCAAPRGIETIVLDRPNPLGGTLVEGAPQRAGYRSFVGLYDVAVRHGMTIGRAVQDGVRRAIASTPRRLRWSR